MNQITKAPKTNRNQPADFDETLAAPINLSGVAASRPRLTTNQMRLGLGVVWVAAALLAGVGIGRIIKSTGAPQLGAESPAPVATASVKATNAASGSVGPAAAVSAPSLKVTPAFAIMQAQAGNVFITLALTRFQGAQAPDALQPGYTTLGRSQGNIGTTPVN